MPEKLTEAQAREWRGWAIYNHWGDLWSDTLTCNRGTTIAVFLRQWRASGDDRTWRRFYREGYRARRVVVAVRRAAEEEKP